MMFNTFCKIDEIVKKYTEAYFVGNNRYNFDIFLEAMVNEENKELLLNELDKCLPYNIYFNHDYYNGKLKVVFKELI